MLYMTSHYWFSFFPLSLLIFSFLSPSFVPLNFFLYSGVGFPICTYHTMKMDGWMDGWMGRSETLLNGSELLERA
jgi:hypothetical protein